MCNISLKLYQTWIESIFSLLAICHFVQVPCSVQLATAGVWH